MTSKPTVKGWELCVRCWRHKSGTVLIHSVSLNFNDMSEIRVCTLLWKCLLRQRRCISNTQGSFLRARHAPGRVEISNEALKSCLAGHLPHSFCKSAAWWPIGSWEMTHSSHVHLVIRKYLWVRLAYVHDFRDRCINTFSQSFSHRNVVAGGLAYPKKNLIFWCFKTQFPIFYVPNMQKKSKLKEKW